MVDFKQISVKILELLPDIGIGIAILGFFIILSMVIKNTITKRIKPKTKNPLLAVFLGKTAGLIIVLLGFIIFLNIIGLGGISKQILAGAGITTFVIGFAFKDIGENFLSGIMMAFKSPFQVGDLIETQGAIGYVLELNMRDSLIKTLDGKDVYIPNSQIIKSPLFNYTMDGYLRYEINVGLDYSIDINNTLEIIKLALSDIPEVLQGEKKPVIVVDELAVSTVNVRVLYWIDTFKSKSKAFHLSIKSKVILKLIEEFAKNNIYLPADIIEIKNYKENDLTIKNS